MLSQDLHRYTVLQRARGMKFTTQPSLLRGFVAFATAAGDTHVRTARVLEWAAQTTSAMQARNRLAIARRFALALAIEDSEHEVPPAEAFGPWQFERRLPHIYSAEEIATLLAGARRLGSPGSIRPETMATLIGLLAATGLRVSEALRLDIADLTNDGLIIRESKFRKSRLVPLHPTARAALNQYLQRRRKVPGQGTSLFVGDSGRRPVHVTLYGLFMRIGREAGLRGLPGEKGPRLHDLRHTFAVRSLESCTGDRRAISLHMLALSTYLGHSDPKHTWWYIHATPALMQHIAEAGEALLSEVSP